ncbi:MAG: hypothetical protein ACSHWU_00165 [Marinicella sp.]
MKKLILGTFLMAVATVSFGQCDNGNLAVWSNFQDNGDVNVTAASAMNGTTCGVAVSVNHTTKSFVADQNATNELSYRAAMYIDPNSISMPTSGINRRLKIHNAQCTVGTCPNVGMVQFKLENTAGGYSIKGYVRDGNQANTLNKYDVPLADGPNRVEYYVNMTTGTFRLWVDAATEGATPVVDLSGLDMAAWSGGISEARIGNVNNPENVAEGQTVFVDEFESRRTTFIGL